MRTNAHERVDRALGLVPRGDLAQNSFRACLNDLLMNAFGGRPEHPSWTMAQTIDSCAEIVQLQYPGFQPEYDAQLLEMRLGRP